MKVKWLRNSVCCNYKEANEMMIECRECGNDIVMKFQTRKWKCPHCEDKIQWIGLIYKAESRYDKKVYIGQTKTPLRERINGHKCNVTTVFDRRVNKYGPDNFDWSVVEFLEGNPEELQESLNELEKKYIKEYNTFVGWEGSLGLNYTTGGNQTEFSPDSIRKRSGENHPQSLLTKEKVKTIKLLLRDTGMYLAEIAKLMGVSLAAIFDVKREKSWEDIKINDSDKLGEEYLEYKSFPKERRKLFYAFEIGSCDFLGELFDRKECAELLGINRGDVSKVLYGRAQTAGIYTFILKDEYTEEWKDNVLPHLKNNKGKEFHVYNFRTNELKKKYNNIYDCANDLEINYRTVSKCLNGNQSYCGDFVFVYDEIRTDEYVEMLIENATYNKKYAPKGFHVYNFITGKYVNTYDNQRECARELSLNFKCISLCTNGKVSYHQDYIFVNEDECTDEVVEKLIEEARTNATRKRVNFHVYDFQTREHISQYTSVAGCARELEICKQGISDCLHDRRSLVGRYVFVNDKDFSQNLVESKIKIALERQRFSTKKI
ncbi:NUMOD1 domain-containing DNA-binding protein [Bacillus tropicus]|uniref:GIY-YIG nuclease family protein n=1 Tax=Bacillus tropicus TaxID=2026188 RepID=UPI0026996707|nr:NUMOD1 domain-containing DNA-binding protein [Bacillus tropicus]